MTNFYIYDKVEMTNFYVYCEIELTNIHVRVMVFNATFNNISVIPTYMLNY